MFQQLWFKFQEQKTFAGKTDHPTARHARPTVTMGTILNTHVYRPAPLRAPHEHRCAIYFLIELLLLCDWSDSVICGTNCCLIIKHWIRFILSVVTADLKYENITNIWGRNEFKSVVLSDPETPPPQHTPYLIGVGRADCTGPPADVPMVSTTNSLMLPSGTRAAFNMKSPICAQNCAKVLSHSSVLYALLLQRQTLWLFLKCFWATVLRAPAGGSQLFSGVLLQNFRELLGK